MVKPFLAENVCFFPLLSTIKANLVAKIMQSAYLFFMWSTKKSPFLAVLTWFPILGKSQGGSQDGDHCWWRYRLSHSDTTHKIYLILFKKKTVFPLKSKSFRNIVTYPEKLRGGVPSSPPPPSLPPLFHGGGTNLLVRPRVNQKSSTWTTPKSIRWNPLSMI